MTLMEGLNLSLAETFESFLMKALFYFGLFNWLIILIVFIINGNITLELVKKMRKFILYSFVITAIPFAAAVIRYFSNG